MTAYILSEWKNGASYTKGYTPEEYYYKQILDSIKFNSLNKSLPFFNINNSALIREITTGKIINDENLIALEQVAAKNNYKSNLWLYGNELEKLQKQGIKINFKSNVEPVLCMTKYKNPIHLSNELYINEAGTKSNFQFLYNFDSLDERTQKELHKYYNKAKELDRTESEENFEIFVKNMKNEFSSNRKNIEAIKTKIKDDRYISNIDCSPLVESQYVHDVYKSVGGKMKTNFNEDKIRLCYMTVNKLFSEIEKGNLSYKEVATNLTKKLYSASIYQRTMTSKNFNLESRKIQEEKMRNIDNLARVRTGYER